MSARVRAIVQSEAHRHLIEKELVLVVIWLKRNCWVGIKQQWLTHSCLVSYLHALSVSSYVLYGIEIVRKNILIDKMRRFFQNPWFHIVINIRWWRCKRMDTNCKIEHRVWVVIMTKTKIQRKNGRSNYDKTNTSKEHHYENPTKRVGLVQSEAHRHLIEKELVLVVIWLKRNCWVGIKQVFGWHSRRIR
jgi:hypothetical protein